MSLRDFAVMSKKDQLKKLIVDRNWQGVLVMDGPVERFPWFTLMPMRREALEDQIDYDVIIDHLDALVPIGDKGVACMKLELGCQPCDINLGILDSAYLFNRLLYDGVVQALDQQGLIDDVVRCAGLSAVDPVIASALVRGMTCMSPYLRGIVDDALHWKKIIAFVRDEAELEELVGHPLGSADPFDIIAECIAHGKYWLIAAATVDEDDVREYFLQLGEDDVDLLLLFRPVMQDVKAMCVQGLVECVRYASRFFATADWIVLAAAYCDDDVKRAKIFDLFPGVKAWNFGVMQCIANDAMRVVMRLKECGRLPEAKD